MNIKWSELVEQNYQDEVFCDWREWKMISVPVAGNTNLKIKTKATADKERTINKIYETVKIL